MNRAIFVFLHTATFKFVKSNSSPPGHLFDLNTLTKEGGYTVYDHQEHRTMFRMNICGSVTNAGCDPDTGTYIHTVTGPPSFVIYHVSINRNWKCAQS